MALFGIGGGRGDAQSGGAAGAAADGPGDKKQQIMDQVRSEMALQNFQELLQRINQKCFKACMTKFGSSMSPSDLSCVQNCTDRYIEAWNVVSSSYMQRLSEKDA